MNKKTSGSVSKRNSILSVDQPRRIVLPEGATANLFDAPSRSIEPAGAPTNESPKAAFLEGPIEADYRYLEFQTWRYWFAAVFVLGRFTSISQILQKTREVYQEHCLDSNTHPFDSAYYYASVPNDCSILLFGGPLENSEHQNVIAIYRSDDAFNKYSYYYRRQGSDGLFMSSLLNGESHSSLDYRLQGDSRIYYLRFYNPSEEAGWQSDDIMYSIGY